MLNAQIENPKPALNRDKAPKIQNRYTDAPELHPNLILGSLHLLFWIIFHPSAWGNYIARIDPTLPAEFTLIDLSRKQWQNRALRRLMIQAYLVLPLLSGTILYPLFWLGNVPPAALLATTLHFTAMALIMSLFFGAVAGLATGMVGGLGTSLLVGIAGSLLNAPFFEAWAFNAAIGLSIGLAAGINGNLKSRKQTYSPARQIGGLVIGVGLGFTMVLTRHGLTAFGEGSGLPGETAYSLARTLLVGASYGLVVGWRRGFVAGLTGGLASGLFYNIVLNTAQSDASDLLRGLSSGGLFGISLIAMFALPYVLATYIAGTWAGAWAGSLASYGRHIYFAAGGRQGTPNWSAMPTGFLGVILGLTMAWWRPVVLYPLQAAWNLLLYRADERRRAGEQPPGRAPGLLRWHAAFWDEGQFLPLYGLDDHLLLIMERDPVEGQAAIEYLATSRQRWAAQAAQIELDARQLERCAGVMAIRKIPRDLASADFSDSHIAALLRSFSRISQDVDAALNQSTAYNQRQALKAVEGRLDGLLRQLTRSSQPYAVRFRLSALRWRQIVADRIQELGAATEALQEINSPYIIGMPLMARQDVFVGRADVSADIEQFLQDRICPPLFLYGQRRMGKTSLLNNLGRLLPSTVLPMFVDLQGPASWATDHAGYLYHIAQAMAASGERERGVTLPALSRESLAADPFIRFDGWLDAVEQTLDAHGLAAALLTLDEFEALDNALRQGRFDEGAVLGMLRHLIQHRPRFKVLLAGSHTLDEFQRWASYLINARLIHLSYLNEAEARQLIEQPIKDFALRYQPEASQRVLELTRGHPFLVQLLCSEIVALKNKQTLRQRRLARLADVDGAVENALSHGGLYFADIHRNQIDAAGLVVLNRLAAQGEGAIVSREALSGALAQAANPDQTLAQLAQRELVEQVDGGYRFQVELIRRWFAQEND